MTHPEPAAVELGRLADKQQATVTAIEKLQVGAARWSEQIPPHEQDRVVLLDGDCKLIDDYIQSQIRRLQMADDRINELMDMLDL